eukprot:355040-Chlamydomonas_euryale.AAC.6
MSFSASSMRSAAAPPAARGAPPEPLKPLPLGIDAACWRVMLWTSHANMQRSGAGAASRALEECRVCGP